MSEAESLRQNERSGAEGPAWDEHDAYLCACKGVPYTLEEWGVEVERLMAALGDARQRRERARVEGGVCLPRRFSGV